MIQNATGMAPVAQRLIYNARPLQDGNKLSDYGKCANATPDRRLS